MKFIQKQAEHSVNVYTQEDYFIIIKSISRETLYIVLGTKKCVYFILYNMVRLW